MDVSREGLGGHVPKREWGGGAAWCCMVWEGWCCPAERRTKAHGSKYLPRILAIICCCCCGGKREDGVVRIEITGLGECGTSEEVFRSEKCDTIRGVFEKAAQDAVAEEGVASYKEST